MKEAQHVWIDETTMQTPSGPGGTVGLDLSGLGIAVLDRDGRIVSANARTRELLGVESPAELEALFAGVRPGLTTGFPGDAGETIVNMPAVGQIGIRWCPMGSSGSEGHVLLLRDGRAAAGTSSLMQEAARHRAFAALARDWAHDLKGMLHVIRINAALLGRLLERPPAATDAAVTKCLEAIPREVERLDRAIEQIFGTRTSEQSTIFDIGRTCEGLRTLIAARANRQRVEVVLELDGGVKEILGFEDQVQAALLNILLNALEAMPDQGRLVIRAEGRADVVTIGISDTGAGMPPRPDDHGWPARFVNDRPRPAIGLHVASAIVESHAGRIECASNVPRGTSVAITFPSAASTGRLRHGSRTHR